MQESFNSLTSRNLYLDSVKVFVLYFLTILVTYQLGSTAKEVLFIIYFVLFLLSKDNVLWLAFFTILRFSPGFLFSEYDVGHELPSYFANRITYADAIVLLFLLKALLSKISFKIKFDLPLILFILYSFFLFFVSFTESVSLIKGFRALKFLIHFSMFLSIPILLNKYENYLRIMNVFLVFAVVIFISQVYLLFNLQHVNSLFGGVLKKEGGDVTISQYENISIVRPLYSGHLLLLNLFSYLWYSASNSRTTMLYRFKLIDLFGSISYLALVLSATRGYILAATIVIGGVLYFQFSDQVSKAIRTVGVVLLFLLTVLSSNMISDQLEKSFFRFSSISLLIEGDETAGGTLVRITNRLPVVLDKFMERPIFGWGYSDEFFEYFDGHVAWATIIMSGGIIGGVIAILLALYLIFDPLLIYRHTGRKEFLAFSLIMIAFISLQTTTFLVFHFLVGITGTFIIFFLYTFYFYYKSSYLIIDRELNGT